MRRNRRIQTPFAQWLDLTLSNEGVLSRTLAEQVGVHDSAVSKWRAGAATPSMGAVTEIARVLTLDPLRLAVTAGLVAPEVANCEPYPLPEPTALRESVRRQISHIKGLSDIDRSRLLDTYDSLVSEAKEIEA